MKTYLKPHVIFISAMLILLYLCSCSTSNKAHWQKVHPHGSYAGNNYLPGDPKQVQFLPKPKK